MNKENSERAVEEKIESLDAMLSYDLRTGVPPNKEGAIRIADGISELSDLVRELAKHLPSIDDTEE